MCGIYGFVGIKNDSLLRQMGRSLAHRGPDDQDEYLSGDIGLGYRRLAIIDIDGSFQPLFNETKTKLLFFNGEIYNYKALRSSLLQAKHKFQTQGDGEVVIHQFEEHGPDGVSHLNGIFGFSLFDKANQKLILARDHFGVKPLYYFAQDGKLIFASEIKAILIALRSLKIPVEPNDQAIGRYLLSRLHDNDEQTFFKNIFRIPPASYLEWSLKTNQFKVTPYWQLKSNSDLVKDSDESNIKEFRDLFLKSIDKQLMSEVPLGTALSGGLDSSAVVLAVNEAIKSHLTSIDAKDLAKVIGKKQKTFSAEFPNRVNDETKYINEVVKTSQVDSQVVCPKREDLWTEINQLISQQDEPMISSGPFAQWEVMKLAKKNRIRVLLDGQGADEMLGGYIPYHFVYFRELFRKGDWLTLFQEVFQSLDVIWPFLKEKFDYLLGFKKTFSPGKLFSIQPPKQTLIKDDLNARLKEDLFHNSLPSLLRYEDHNSMGQSIEARVPFLDIELVEFVASLPSKFKIRHGWNKWIMRQALKDLLPEKILKRRWKVGFTTPEISWLRESPTEIREILTSKSFNSRPYFNHQKIRDTFEEFVQGKNDESMVFWRIINLELWLRIFIDKK